MNDKPSGHVTAGYFRAPELDAESFDREGWFLTGDLGSIEPTVVSAFVVG